MLLSDHFLLVRGIKFLGARSIFVVRYLISFSCCFFFAQNHDEKQPKPHSRGPSIYGPSEGSPEVQMSHRHRNYLQLQNHAPARARGSHSQLLWTPLPLGMQECCF